MKHMLPLLSATLTAVNTLLADKSFSLLKLGNTKLGPTKPAKDKSRNIWHFDLPAVFTCLFSEACIQDCYACSGLFELHQARYQSNWLYTHFNAFMERIAYEIKTNFIQVIRLHVSGDFFSKTYCAVWLAIMQAFPDVKFFFYTRSWQDPEMLEVFQLMADLPNVQVWFSFDRTMPDLKIAHPRIRSAYMLQEGESGLRKKYDLVFRVDQSTPAKKFEGCPVCPAEQGIKRKIKMTCSKCRICINEGKHA